MGNRVHECAGAETRGTVIEQSRRTAARTNQHTLPFTGSLTLDDDDVVIYRNRDQAEST